MPYLHKWSPALVRTLPHTRLGTGPTPVRPLPSLGQSGCEIWLKDESGFGDGGWGGNKVRKLEWLLPDVKRRHRKTILTERFQEIGVGFTRTAQGDAYWCAVFGKK